MGMSRFIKAVQGAFHSIVYTDEAGRFFRFSGGTWAWRNHNPGNIVSGSISHRHGQIGFACSSPTGDKFAIFPDDESGHAALIESLQTTFHEKSIPDLVKIYAPPTENDIVTYEKHLRSKTGVTDDRAVKDFTSEEFQKLWQAIELIEGYKVGKITEVYQIIAVQENKKRTICRCCIAPDQWASKEKCLELAKESKLDVAVCTSRSGHPYMRAIPSSAFQKNLSTLEKMIVEE